MRTPLPAKELFALKAGDKFIVHWAKDDDPQYTRLNYATQTVLQIDRMGDILTEDGYEWMRTEIIDEDRNELDTSRGIARFFKVTQ